MDRNSSGLPGNLEAHLARERLEAVVPRTTILLLLAFSAGATVANIYYSQPLLADIAGSFGIPFASASWVAVATQLGFAAGLLFLVPLGDSFERKELIVITCGTSALTLVALGMSPNAGSMVAASFATGIVSITPQLVVPYAAGLVGPERRGRTVGFVMSGLLIGILFSRTVSGVLGAFVGWRAVFWIAAAAMLLLATLLAAVLPRQHPEHAGRMTYPQLLRSLLPLLGREPVLRRHALVGALGFAAFNTFWTTLAFHLVSLPGRYGSQTAGLFGLIGIAGALAAPIAGRLADRWDARQVNGGALALVALSFGIMAIDHGASLWALALGVVLMDAGVQASHISNQTRIYQLAPELRNRLNSVYMFSSFLGGAAGSALASRVRDAAGWVGVCTLGGLFATGGMVALFVVGRHRAGVVQR